jgi:hypothetical protein
MRVSTTALFQGLDGLRRHVYELEDALRGSNNEVVRLAARVRFLESRLAYSEARLKRLSWGESFQPPEETDNGDDQRNSQSE